jgi:hypothetical protein
MGIVVKRFPDYGLTLDIWRGTVTAGEIIGHFEGMTPAEAELRLSFVDPAVDLYAMDVVAIPGLKRAADRIANELYAGRPMTSAIVCGPGENKPALDFWLRYAWDQDEGRHPVVLSSLEEAFDWLGLPQGARQEVIEVLEAEALTPGG